MSNLNNNTTQLELLLQKVNALPEAGEGGIDTSDATVTSDEIFAGETAYGVEGKLIGTFTLENELAEQNELISQIATLVATKANPQSGTDTSDATATAGDILSGKTAYVKDQKITGTIATVTQATPSVSINSSGLITASVTQTAGYVSAGTKSGTKQLTTRGTRTYKPGTSNQTISSGTYITGTQTIQGDVNLKASNIASGVSIFGVTGTYSGAEDLETELTTQESLISQLSSILDSKASGGGEQSTSLMVPITFLEYGADYSGLEYICLLKEDLTYDRVLIDRDTWMAADFEMTFEAYLGIFSLKGLYVLPSDSSGNFTELVDAYGQLSSIFVAKAGAIIAFE